jgi:phage nucleotide-binding protein
MAIKVENSKGLASKVGIRILLYGATGMGKSFQAIHTGKTIVITSEKADLTLNDYEVDIIKINSSKELREAYLYVKENADKYDTVFIDSLTDIGEMIVSELKDTGNYSAKDTYKLWGDFTDIMVAISKSFRDMQNINVVLICLEKSIKNGFSEKIIPQIPGEKARSKLISLYDIVLRLHTNEDGEREFLCSPTDEWDAKDRSGKLNQIEPCVLKKKQTTDAGLGLIIKKALT